MNTDILDRYDITPDNRFIIDVNIPDPEELFEKYDKNASFYKKDLNPRFEDYLLECVEEIGLQNKFMIQIGLPEDQAEKTDEGDIIYSFKQYFKYCILTCQKEIKTFSLRMLLHLALAICALFIIMTLNAAKTIAAAGFFSQVTSGISVAVWVLLLTGFSRFLFRVWTQRTHIRIYRALEKTHVEFVYK